MAVKKFVKFDSEKGYLDNKDDINYYVTNLMRKVAFGKMLGDFDENGLYVINSKIVEELIKMPKVVVEIIEGADLIRSVVKADSFFHFILSIEDNKATFKLLEKIPYQSNRTLNAGVYSNINEYVLDEVIIPDKDFNRNALYEKYNISINNDGEVLSIFDMDELSLTLYYNIVQKLKIDYLVQNALILKEKELENIEADYFEAILAVFEEYKEFGDKVKEDVKKDLAEKHSFVIISKPFFQKTVNEIIDDYIDLHMQDMSVEQREKLLIKIREIKAQYYQKVKALLPIEISKMAGVRFDNHYVVQEGVIGGLVQEIATKGFTSSDVRKILINEDELSLSIAKIKEMVSENEEICKRDNAKAQDITKDRKLTTEFYQKLEEENKVDILKPETIIKSAIDEKQAKQEKQKQDNKVNKSQQNTDANAKKGNNTVKSAVGGGKTDSAAKTVKAGDKTAGSSAKSTKAQATKTNNTTNAKQTNSMFSYWFGSGDAQKSQSQDVKKVNSNLVEDLLGDDVRTAKASTDNSKSENFVHAQVDELTK